MSKPHDLPGEIARFIADCIDSVEQIDILLLLRAAPARRWSSDELSRHLRSSVASVNLRLTALVARGLAVQDRGLVRYSARGADDALIARLAAAYSERRPAVIDRIFAERDDPMQSFADAFRLRPENDDC